MFVLILNILNILLESTSEFGRSVAGRGDEHAKRKQDDQNVQRPHAKQHRPVSRDQFTPGPSDDVFEPVRD